jgi:hypothetical protein
MRILATLVRYSNNAERSIELFKRFINYNANPPVRIGRISGGS